MSAFCGNNHQRHSLTQPLSHALNLALSLSNLSHQQHHQEHKGRRRKILRGTSREGHGGNLGDQCRGLKREEPSLPSKEFKEKFPRREHQWAGES
jgi:hypothetical protein